MSCGTVFLDKIVSCVLSRSPFAVNPYCGQSPVAAETLLAENVAAARRAIPLTSAFCILWLRAFMIASYFASVSKIVPLLARCRHRPPKLVVP
jgi:hypothetical protein